MLLTCCLIFLVQLSVLCSLSSFLLWFCLLYKMNLPSCCPSQMAFCRKHYLFLYVHDRRWLHASTLQALINHHWQLWGHVHVIQQHRLSFVLQFSSALDAAFILHQGTWLLQGFTLLVFAWTEHQPLSTAAFSGDLFGSFQCYDCTSFCSNKVVKFSIQY